jgi:fluoride ion exporter CrcB/FEX
MTPKDWWIVGFGLRCFTLLAVELGCFLFVVPTLFNLHSDAADAGAAVVALVGLVGGFASVTALSRELASLTSDKDP